VSSQYGREGGGGLVGADLAARARLRTQLRPQPPPLAPSPFLARRRREWLYKPHQPQGMEGAYRLRIYAEGLWVAETVDIRVAARVDLVRVGLPASLQARYPGCGAEWIAPTSDNSVVDEQAICLSLPTFAPLEGGLPYVDAFVCSVPTRQGERVSLEESCEPVTGKRVRVEILSGSSKANANPPNWEPGGVVRRWDFDGTDMEGGNVSFTTAVTVEALPPGPTGRQQVTRLTSNHVFAGASPTFLRFSVGGTVRFGAPPCTG
jgi:hypothetical protein